MKLRVLVFASLFTLAGVVDGHANPVRSGASLQPQNAESPQQLVRDMVWNEIHAQTNDHTYWHYLEVQEDNAPGRLVDVFQTRDGQIHRVLAIDGQPLTGEQLEIEDKRIQRLLSDPRQLRENQKKREQDANQEMTMLEMLPDAFLFREEGQPGSSVELAFTPNPSFHPTTHAAEVFHHMVGNPANRPLRQALVEIDGRLTSKVKFGGGLLGHLDERGTFSVEQRNVGTGHWDMALLDVHMSGKVLFFKTIAVRQREDYFDYHEVPGSVTLPQAAQELKKDATNPPSLSGH